MLHVRCSPGPESLVSIQGEAPEHLALVLYLEPGSVEIHCPPVADGDVVLSRFLRKVSREATKLATALEARRVTGVSPDEPLTDHPARSAPEEGGES